MAYHMQDWHYMEVCQTIVSQICARHLVCSQHWLCLTYESSEHNIRSVRRLSPTMQDAGEIPFDPICS